MRRSNEPLWWVPFGAGMMVDALVVPALVLITGILIPLGFISEDVRGIIHHPLTRLFLFAVIALSFIHAAHRMRLTLAETGFKGAKAALPFIFYGAAILGTLVAGAIAVGIL